MSQPIKKVISQVYELEGLLLLIQNHGVNTDPFIYEMARKKSNSIVELVSTLSPDIFSKQAEIMPKINEEKQEITNEDKIEDVELNTINLSEFDGMMLGADNSYDLDDITEDIIEEEEIEEEEIEVEIIYDETQPEPESNISEEDDEVIETAEEDTEEEDEAETESDEEVIEKTEEVEIVEETPIVTQEIVEEPITNHTPSADFKSVRKAFSLNDRFRYKRELFANSDVEMNNTLDLVDTMETFAEAEEYFYNDLQWDKESFEVIDFMFIIRNHF